MIFRPDGPWGPRLGLDGVGPAIIRPCAAGGVPLEYGREGLHQETGVALFEIDGGTLYYEERGEGPPIVFVHGLACAQEDWRNQVSQFAPAYHVVSLDLRGHGRSTGHTSGFDMLTYGADVAALIAHLELPAAVLVGHSMGCKVVLECARIAPEAVAGLVLIDGSRLAAADANAVRRNVRAAVVAAGSPEGFRLVEPMGPFHAFRTARITGCPSTRTATPFPEPSASTSVRAPGQNREARCIADTFHSRSAMAQ